MVQIFVDFRWKCEDNHSRNCRCDYLASVFASCFPIVSDKINGILGFSSHFPKQMLHFPSPKRAHPMDEFQKPGQKVQHLHSSAGPGPSSGNWIYPNPGPGHQSHQSRHPETVEGGRQKERKTAHRMKKPGFSWRWFVSFSQYPMGNPLREFFLRNRFFVFLFPGCSGSANLRKHMETRKQPCQAMLILDFCWFGTDIGQSAVWTTLLALPEAPRAALPSCGIAKDSSAVKFDVGTERELDFSAIYIAGWWFGTWIILYCSIRLGISPPQLTHVFQRGRYTTNQSLIYGECKNGVHDMVFMMG